MRGCSGEGEGEVEVGCGNGDLFTSSPTHMDYFLDLLYSIKTSVGWYVFTSFEIKEPPI